MATVTRGTKELDRLGIEYTSHTYELTAEADSYGEAVAAQLGVAADRLFKTLLAAVDGSPVVAIVPVSGRLSLKALARAAGGKKAEMIPAGEAERLTGYVTGGISPFGQRRRLSTYVDETVRHHSTVYCSGGLRGLQLELSPYDLLAALDAATGPLSS